MLVRIFLFLVGFGLVIVGLMYSILYFNLFCIGYNFFEYVNFIIRRIECLNLFFGIILMIISIVGGKKDEQCI